jgi:protein-S-isoprenylcysteine O-methyltransferase Ste14
MQRYLAALTIAVLLGTVMARVAMLRRRGVRAMSFGKQDKTDFLIPPFAFFYFYLVFAHAFGWPTTTRQTFFDSGAAAWLGVALCGGGLLFLFWSLVSFGRSFRVGIDVEGPGALVTSGIFGISRNPMYVAFALLLLGEFLIQPSVVFLAYLLGGLWLFHRQVLREEGYLSEHYGEAYRRYTERVRRYI